MSPSPLRRRLVFGLLGAALSLVMVTVVSAQVSRERGCTWRGWYAPGGASPELLPGTSRIVTLFGDECTSAGIKNHISGINSWLAMRLPGDIVQGAGFTIERRTDSEFALIVGNAVPGEYILVSLEDGGVVQKPFIVARAQDPERTLGFCCREVKSGERCDRMTTAGSGPSGQARCSNGETYVPNTGNYAEKRNFCDYQVCEVPGTCYVPNANVVGVEACSTVSRTECLAKSGEFHGDWSLQYCSAFVAQGGNPHRYYCDPSDEVPYFDEEGDLQTETAAVCTRVSPSELGPYSPIDGGFKYRALDPGTYDSFADSQESCDAICGFTCVYLPVLGTVTKGCISIPVTASGEKPCDLVVNGRLLPPYCPPLTAAERAGLTPRELADKSQYHQAEEPNAVSVNGKFDTQQECSLYCRN